MVEELRDEIPLIDVEPGQRAFEMLLDDPLGSTELGQRLRT